MSDTLTLFEETLNRIDESRVQWCDTMARDILLVKVLHFFLLIRNGSLRCRCVGHIFQPVTNKQRRLLHKTVMNPSHGNRFQA